MQPDCFPDANARLPFRCLETNEFRLKIDLRNLNRSLQVDFMWVPQRRGREALSNARRTARVASPGRCRGQGDTVPSDDSKQQMSLFFVHILF